ncbi:MAG: S9 family peptidase, partial [Pseudomonadota bacterium]
PSVDGIYAYLVRYRTGGEHPIYARKPVSDMYDSAAEDEVLLDGDAMGKGFAYFDFGAVRHAPNHKLLAYAVDDQGSEFYDIRFKNLETGDLLSDQITRTAGDFVWGANSDRVFWVERDDQGRPQAVHMYVLGADRSVEIYREPDPGFFVSVDDSQSGDYIFISAGSHTTSEVRFFASDATAPEPKLIAARQKDIEYAPEHWGEEFVILTNRDDAVDFKIVTAPLHEPSPENWRDAVPHQPGTLILDVAVLKDFMIRLERHLGLPRLIVRDRNGAEQTVAFDEAAYALGMSTGYEYDTTQIRLAYSSPTTPQQTYDYDLATGDRILRKTQDVPSGHDPSVYEVERLLVTARDGADVPVTLLKRKDTPIDGTAPLLLYGYGSYGITIPASFRTSPLSLVDRGMIYAIAHIRGSKAKGYQWYLDGKLEQKENTFNDYVDVGRYLATHGYTSTGQIVGMGGSAGGLLMGAVANQDPDLFAGIIAAVPFVDVLNTMSDGTLPLTPPEWPEWGNPITSAEDYDTIQSYSPYDQIADQAYPAMLITGGLSDPRVTYWEPAKWAAVLRHEAPQGGPYFLRINMDAGHGGASGRFEGLKETALEYAFALAASGKTNALAFD